MLYYKVVKRVSWIGKTYTKTTGLQERASAYNSRPLHLGGDDERCNGARIQLMPEASILQHHKVTSNLVQAELQYFAK